MLELQELEDDRLVTDAHPGRIGVAAVEVKAAGANEIFVLSLVESATCK